MHCFYAAKKTHMPNAAAEDKPLLARLKHSTMYAMPT
jgi:hypothetical protein